MDGHLGVRYLGLFGLIMDYGHPYDILTYMADFSIIFPDFS